MNVVVPAIHRLVGNRQEFWEPLACNVDEPLSPVTDFLLEVALSHGRGRSERYRVQDSTAND